MYGTHKYRALLTFVLVPALVLAETNTPHSSTKFTTPAPLTVDQQSNPNTAVSQLPTTPVVNPSEPPPQQQSDRKEGQGAAAAMAAVGAAIAGASCAMLMQQAMKEPPGSKERSQLMTMAMQQCAQAAQSAANAAQNKEGQKKLSQSDIPKQAQLQTPQQIKAPENKSENSLPELTQEGEEKLAEGLKVELPEEIETPAPLDPASPSAPVDQAFASANPVSFTKLTPIERASQFYQDNDNTKKVPTPTSPLYPGSTAGPNLGNGTATADTLKKMVGLEVDAKGSGGREAGGELESVGGSSESSGEKSGSDNSAFDAMLAQLMGPTGEVGGIEGGGVKDFVNLPTGSHGEQKVNIFQYASFRYQYAAYNENKIKLRPPRIPLEVTLAGIP